jgi:lipid A 3-O-deacylase
MRLHLPRVLACALSVVAAATAAEPLPAQRVEQISVQADNDAFNLWMPRHNRPDYEYTHGTRINVRTRSAPWWGQRFAAARPLCNRDSGKAELCLATSWELGQMIYTPRVDSERVIEGQRPYAGWLYGAATAHALAERERHSFRLELGVTGPPSFAATLQTAVHRLGGFWEPQGWENQLPFEAGILGRYEYARIWLQPSIGGVRIAELSQQSGLSAGNVITGADTELNARIGFNVPHAWRPGPARSPLAVYLSGSVRATGFLRNLFLDGSTFHESPRVDKIPVTAHFVGGLGARVRAASLEYRGIWRTRAYETEPDGHRYSSFVLTIRR